MKFLKTFFGIEIFCQLNFNEHRGLKFQITNQLVSKIMLSSVPIDQLRNAHFVIKTRMNF